MPWHGRALLRLALVAIVPIESNVVSSPEKYQPIRLGVCMRVMHLCYAAIGFAVARWIFRRQAMPLADPVTRFRSSGLL
jgi:hypothetical protein